jgi:hypothetical protein
LRRRRIASSKRTVWEAVETKEKDAVEGKGEEGEGGSVSREWV